MRFLTVGLLLAASTAFAGVYVNGERTDVGTTIPTNNFVTLDTAQVISGQKTIGSLLTGTTNVADEIGNLAAATNGLVSDVSSLSTATNNLTTDVTTLNTSTSALQSQVSGITPYDPTLTVRSIPAAGITATTNDTFGTVFNVTYDGATEIELPDAVAGRSISVRNTAYQQVLQITPASTDALIIPGAGLLADGAPASSDATNAAGADIVALNGSNWSVTATGGAWTNATSLSASYPWWTKVLRRYTFDATNNPTAGTTADTSPYEDHASINQGTSAEPLFVSSNDAGIAWNAFEFDGNNDHLLATTNDYGAIKASSEGTFACWAYSTDDGVGEHDVFGMAPPTSDGDRHLGFGINAARPYLTCRTISSYCAIQAPAGDALTTNTWYHLAFTADGSSYVTYINGTQSTWTVTSGSNHGSWINADTNGASAWTKMTFSSYFNNGVGYLAWNGWLARPQLWNRALTTGEVAAVFAQENTDGGFGL